MANLEKIVENRGLGNLIYDIKVPVETVIEKNGDKEKEVEVKVFPGYVLVKMTMTDESWHAVRNIRGVTGFVGPESKPSPLRDDELIALGLADKIADAEAVEEEVDDFIDIFNVRIEVNYSVGDRVNVISGQFEGMGGIVKSIDLEREVVTVNLPFMGRETPTELGLDEVELA